MLKESIIIAVIPGVFALAGGFLGVLLTRRTEHQKWLRQERSVAFAEFLRQVHTVLEKAGPIVYGSELKQQRDLMITELFMGLNAQEYIVRLFLPVTDRDNFSGLIRRLFALHCGSTPIEHKIKGVKEILREIQSLFERTIDGQISWHGARHGEAKTP